MNSTQSDFQSESGGATQNDKLEKHFREHPCEWLDLPDLVEVAGAFAVHSRVSDLRKDRGMAIQHKNTWATEDGHSKIFSRYRFVPVVLISETPTQAVIAAVAAIEYQPNIEILHNA